MRNYELTLVLPGKATAAKKKDAVEKLEKLLKINNGKVVNSEDWGVKDLAYSIKKNEAGVFLYFDIELPPQSLKNLRDKVRLDGDIIRYLLVVKE